MSSVSRLTAFCRRELDNLAARGLLRFPRQLQPLPGGRALLEGKVVLSFASNDYLGLGHHPRVREKEEEMPGAGGARTAGGERIVHRELERTLAEWCGEEEALLFSSGYLVGVGIIPALAGPGDLILSDQLNHSSLIDGCRLSGAEVRVYAHADPEAAEAILRRERHLFRHCLIVTDSVFSADGDLAPLPHLSELAERYEAWLLVDEAHALGVLGPRGGGAAELFGLQGRLAVRTATLSKALASQGGIALGSAPLRQFLLHRSRPALMSTMLSPWLARSALRAAEIARRESWRRERIQENSHLLREGLRDMGFSIPDQPTAIVPLVVGEPEQALRLAASLLEEGVFVPVFRPPAVPPGTARLRFTVTAAHRREDIEEALSALRRCLGRAKAQVTAGCP